MNIRITVTANKANLFQPTIQAGRKTVTLPARYYESAALNDALEHIASEFRLDACSALFGSAVQRPAITAGVRR